MATTVGTFGISQHSGTLIESVEISRRISEKLVIDKDGTFGQAHGYDPVISFSVRGRGTTTVSAGDSASGLSSVTGGKIIITSVRTSQNNDDFPSFEYSGDNYPSAT
jgi:hypothetical protein